MTNTATSSATESFPDPKRSWKRSGVLLGVWVVVWAAAAVFGAGWNAVAGTRTQDPNDEPPTSAYSVADTYMIRVFEDKSFAKADELRCPGADLNAKEVHDNFVSWWVDEEKDLEKQDGKSDGGKMPSVSVDALDESSNSIFDVSLTVQSDTHGDQALNYKVKIRNGDSPCVSSVVKD